MTANLNTSLPAIDKKPRLTSNADSKEFLEAYDAKRKAIDKDVGQHKQRLADIGERLKALEAREKDIAAGGTGGGAMTARPDTKADGKDKKPDPAKDKVADLKVDPKADPKKADPKADANKDKKPDPKADPKVDAAKDKKPETKQDKKPDAKPETKNSTRQLSKEKKVDPLANIQKPLLDPKLLLLMPIYKEKRKLKQEEAKIKEKIKELESKKVSVMGKEKELMVRQNIFSSVNISQEFVKARKEANRSMQNIKTAAMRDSSGNVDAKKLQILRKGFYLDVLESTNLQKSTFKKGDKKYDVNFIIKRQKEHAREVKFKKEMVQLKGSPHT